MNFLPRTKINASKTCLRLWTEYFVHLYYQSANTLVYKKQNNDKINVISKINFQFTIFIISNNIRLPVSMNSNIGNANGPHVIHYKSECMQKL